MSDPFMIISLPFIDKEMRKLDVHYAINCIFSVLFSHSFLVLALRTEKASGLFAKT